MGGLHLRPWEPEETIGTLWHRFVEPLGADVQHPAALVSFDEMQTRMGVLFRALGGDRSVDVKAGFAEAHSHRRSFLRKLGHAEERVEQAFFDGEQLAAPTSIAAFPEAADNAGLYLWLAGFCAAATAPASLPPDPLQADIEKLRLVRDAVEEACATAPGLAALYRRLTPPVLAQRKVARLPAQEVAIEYVIRHMLGSADALPPDAQGMAAAINGDQPAPKAHAGYRPFRPVILWPDFRPPETGEKAGTRHEQGGSGKRQEGAERKRAVRRKSDEANRRDSLILHRFETIKAWVDFLNLNRKVEDDDETSAKKAADDADQLGLADVDKRPATRLAFDLDLSPQDVDREKLAGTSLYPEWDHRRGSYIADHVRVLVNEALVDPVAGPFLEDAARQRRIRAVRRQFEALRPRRMMRQGEFDGDELDTDAAVRLVAELQAGLSGNERVFRRYLNQARDLFVASLIDTSRSTESIVDERTVIATAQEAMLALAHGLQATGDAHAMFSFSSLRRDRVFVTRLKGFEEPMSRTVEQRIASLKPGFYTRLGGAIRHVAKELSIRGATRRLLLIITDGKPNDLDHYEGRHGIEDTRKAVMEARMAGHAVFAITIDRKALAYVPHIFGRNGYAIVTRPSRLSEALPQVYRHLVS